MKKINNIKFRYATEKDRDFFADILLHDYDAKIRLDFIGGMEKLEWKTDKWNMYIVGEIANKLIGFFYISTFSDRNMSRLCDLYIIKEYRGNGHASRLLEYAEDLTYRNWVANGIDVFTIDNKSMEKLLKTHGFKCKGIYKDYYCREGKYYSQKWWIKLYK